MYPYSYQYPPPSYDPPPPSYYDDTMDKMKQKQVEIDSLLQQLLNTKDATLSKTTQDTIRNIMFIFEQRFDLLEQDLLTKIKETSLWIDTIPIVEKEHVEMKATLDKLLSHTQLLDAHIREIETKINDQKRIEDHTRSLVEPLVERITMLEKTLEKTIHLDEQKYIVDRWTDPKNAICLLPMGYLLSQFTLDPRSHHPNTFPYLYSDFLLKPLPHYIIDEPHNTAAIQSFFGSRRHEYLCPCYNCILSDMLKINVNYSNSTNPTNNQPYQHIQRMICPLDSECTCMNLQHRIMFAHSIEAGYIKGRDHELSPIQRFYAKQAIKNPQENLVCIPDITGHKIDATGILYKHPQVVSVEFAHRIMNCTRRYGQDIYQYQIANRGPPHLYKFNIHETFEDKLYVETNQYEYLLEFPVDKSLRQSIIYVPIEKYISDTMFSDSLFSGKKPSKKSKPSKSKPSKSKPSKSKPSKSKPSKSKPSKSKQSKSKQSKSKQSKSKQSKKNTQRK